MPVLVSWSPTVAATVELIRVSDAVNCASSAPPFRNGRPRMLLPSATDGRNVVRDFDLEIVPFDAARLIRVEPPANGQPAAPGMLFSSKPLPKRTAVSPWLMTPLPPAAIEPDVTSGGTCTPLLAQPKIVPQ